MTELKTLIREIINLLYGKEEEEVRTTARPAETCLLHRDGRHGLYLRDDGTTDIFSATSVIGISDSGIAAKSPATYIQTRGMAISADRLSLDVPPDGLMVAKREVSSRILQGLRLCAQKADALLLMHPLYAPITMETNADKPEMTYEEGSVLVVHEGMTIPAIPLSELLDREPFSNKPSSRWIDEQLEILRRSLEEEW